MTAGAASPAQAVAARAAVLPTSRPCLILNPRSFRASRGLAEKAAALALARGAEVVQVGTRAATNDAVRSILARRQRHVAVLAGDGTVQAIVDQLAHLPPGAWIPDLLVLPGGRSNLTAADLLPREPALATLQAALQRAAGAGWEETVVERTLLRVEQGPGPTHHGFFLGAALVDSIVRRTHRHRAEGSGPLRTGAFSTAWFLLRLSLLDLAGRSNLAYPLLDVDAGALGRLHEPVRVLLATTLRHASGRFDPYAARGEGELRLSAVARRAPRFRRSLPRLLSGRYSAAMNLDNGYLSGRCERIQITGLRGYSLDGEAFETDPAGPVVISAGPRLRFVQP